MDTALYGPAGFYRSSGAPGRHFRTAAHTGTAWAEAIAALVGSVDGELGRPSDFTVAEVGAGGGELLAGLAALGPDRWSLVGVDVAPRPADLPERIEWLRELPTAIVGVLIAVEWLDVVPVDVVECSGDEVRVVEVDANGRERLGPIAPAEDEEWLNRWWPLHEEGDRAEVGRPRDDAWRSALANLERGVAVAVDYAAVPARDVAGTLTGYGEGRQTMPVPDGSMDITAHVLFESLADSRDGVLLTQREALRVLGIEARRPAYEGDPTSYLQQLSHAGDEAELIDPGGLGGFTWLVESVGIRNPMAAD